MFFSLIAFPFGGLSALASYKIEKTPKNYLSAILGILTLGTLVLSISGRFLKLGNFLSLGLGGIERMVIYPAMLWGIGLDSYIRHSPESS
jgi:hypothetical protein